MKAFEYSSSKKNKKQKKKVAPASRYPAEVQEHGGKVAVFNTRRSKGDLDADFLFLGPCEETLVEALQLGSHVGALLAESPATG